MKIEKKRKCCIVTHKGYGLKVEHETLFYDYLRMHINTKLNTAKCVKEKHTYLSSKAAEKRSIFINFEPPWHINDSQTSEAS